MEPRLKPVGRAPSEPMDVKRWARRGAQALLLILQKENGMWSSPGDEVEEEERAVRTSWGEMMTDPAEAARCEGMGVSSLAVMAA